MDQTSKDGLFPGCVQADAEPLTSAGDLAAPPRLRKPDRAQVLLRPCSLEEVIAEDHPARVVWDVVGRWDLSRFLEQVKARGESPGRASTDPRLLVSLWLFAYTQGVSMGRELERLTSASSERVNFSPIGLPSCINTRSKFLRPLPVPHPTPGSGGCPGHSGPGDNSFLPAG